MTAADRGEPAEVVLDDGQAVPPGGWHRPDAPERFSAHAARVAHMATANAGPTPLRWVTWRQANRTAVRACLLQRRPGGRRLDVAKLVRTLDHLLAAHVLAAEAITAVRPDDRVTVDIAMLGIYELGPLLADLSEAPSLGVARPDLGPWVASRRAEFNAAVPSVAGPLGRGLRIWVAAAIAGERALPRAVGALYPATPPATSGPEAGSSSPRTRLAR
ncbi:MAG: hypothetical protein ACRD1K_14130 [Acidimicrobiales bacterium]